MARHLEGGRAEGSSEGHLSRERQSCWDVASTFFPPFVYAPGPGRAVYIRNQEQTEAQAQNQAVVDRGGHRSSLASSGTRWHCPPRPTWCSLGSGSATLGHVSRRTPAFQMLLYLFFFSFPRVPGKPRPFKSPISHVVLQGSCLLCRW